MEDRVIGMRTGFGLMGSTILCGLSLVGLVIGIVLLRDNVVWFAGLIGGAVVMAVGLVWGLYNLTIAPPKNSIELVGGRLYVRPGRGEEHVLELCEITRVEGKIHTTGFADQYYGKVIIETRNKHYVVPFVAGHRKVAEEIRLLLK
ncbi:MAG: hypothetical protein FWE16_04070 [Firmicutes bacterium]|nr:hypothetical protein [Bacillota bacterium]